MPTGIYDRKHVRRIEPSVTPTDADCAYLGGIIDGEGSIMVIHHKPSPSNGTKYEYWVLRVLIANTNRILIDWLLERWGGGYSIGVSKNDAWKDTYQWRADSAKAVPILKDAFPHLKLKRRQAELAFEMMSTARATGCKGHSPETVEARRRIAEEVRALNKRGKAA